MPKLGREWQVVPERIKRLFDYDPITGLLSRTISMGGAATGSLVGTQNGLGYLQVVIDGVTCVVHRVIWCWVKGAWPEDEIDHNNGVKDDNRWTNLRPADRAQNQANTARIQTAYPKGVYRHHLKFRAIITVRGVRQHLGLFPTVEGAARAYACAAVAAHGDYAHPSVRAWVEGDRS